MSTTLAESPSPKLPIAVTRAGLQLRTLDEIWRFATCLAKSGLAPKGIESPEAITIAVQMGMEIGLPPMAALQNIAVINGRPSLWGDAQLAVCRATGELEQFEEWFEVGGTRLPRNPTEYKDDTAAVCRVKRSTGATAETAFSVADAKRAGLWDKAGPWKQYPFRMLRFRARSYALRDAFGDALRGLMSAEEAMDLPPKEVTGRVVEPFPIADSLPPTIPGASAGPDAASPSNGAAGTDSPPVATPALAPVPVAESTGMPGNGAEITRPNQGLGAAGAQTQAPSHEQGSQQPLKGANPARRTPPKAETLTLSDERESTYQRLTRKIFEAGLVHAKIETFLSKNDFPPLSMLSQTDAEQVLELFGALQEEAKK